MTTATPRNIRDLPACWWNGWRIWGTTTCWWARCPTCLCTVEAESFELLEAGCKAHMAAGCGPEF